MFYFTVTVSRDLDLRFFFHESVSPRPQVIHSVILKSTQHMRIYSIHTIHIFRYVDAGENFPTNSLCTVKRVDGKLDRITQYSSISGTENLFDMQIKLIRRVPTMVTEYFEAEFSFGFPFSRTLVNVRRVKVFLQS